MSRYTHNNLQADIMEINFKLMRVYNNNRDMYPNQAQDLYLVVGQRNGYTALDCATKDEIARHCVYSNLTAGTPRECYNRALEFIVGQL